MNMTWEQRVLQREPLGVHQLLGVHYCILYCSEGSSVPEPECPRSSAVLAFFFNIRSTCNAFLHILNHTTTVYLQAAFDI